MKKRLWSLLLALTLLLTANNLSYANQKEIKILLNGEYITGDSGPFIENNRAYVPIRLISEAMGFKVSWFPEEKKVAVFLPEHENTGGMGLILYINQNSVFMPGDDFITQVDAAPRIVNNRTFVPIRLVAEAFNSQVHWDDANRTVIVENIIYHSR